MAPLERDGYEPEWCQCGHPQDDHKSAGTSWPAAPRFGVCLVQGCRCQQYEPSPMCEPEP